MSCSCETPNRTLVKKAAQQLRAKRRVLTVKGMRSMSGSLLSLSKNRKSCKSRGGKRVYKRS